MIVTEWKFYRIQYLNVQVCNTALDNELAKAYALRDYKLPEILKLTFNNKERYKRGTIGSWVRKNAGPQLSGYVKSSDVQELKNQGLELQAHLVIIVGSRHILLWDMDEEGELAVEPRLVETPDRRNRYGDQDFCS